MTRSSQQQQQQPQGRPARHISGPQSALTDFLASHNISANQIRLDAAQRHRAANESRAETSLAEADGTVRPTNDNSADGSEGAPGAADDSEMAVDPASTTTTRSTRSRRETKAQEAKRKQDEQKAINKIKASKAFKKRKRNLGSDESDDDLAHALFEQTRAPLPGQMDNCAVCSVRFTVTPYSRASPDGGLLCNPCGKELDKEAPKPKRAQKKSAGGVGRRRTIQSRILDGTFSLGAKPLVTLCVETLAKNVDLAESLGDLPEHQIDRIARLFSKRRLLNPRTLPLFFRPSTETLVIYDGAYLGGDDFRGFLQVTNNLRKLKIRNGIQFKDDVMEYLLSRDIKLTSFSLSGANLLSETMWCRFLRERGADLEALQVYYTDKHVGDDMIDVLRDHCPKLNRLKIYHNQKLTNEGVKKIAELKRLRHLGLNLINKTTSKAYVKVVEEIGADLETLSLKVVSTVEDDLLAAIHNNCRSLVKLQITDSERMTDEGFVHLFENWENPPLRHVDFQKCRHLDSTQPRVNEDLVGLCSDGFRALMKHSRKELISLNVHACRHISREAFEEAFNEDTVYPELKSLEISFCEEVTPFIMSCMFRCCPKLQKMNVFGCMKVKDKDLRVPPGVNLVGGSDTLGTNYDVTEG